ncbi:hypothetical protein L596_004098 [Steinernema carpocapsae]|uniref:TATA element modulatory factor 1 TATA binding domain-containing protein n=1 Tax=Steinernema carpocapsae TaxID=34508 RepID=A0A4U8UWB0_STECR|nr:hypothetical protein L596_004098 [Steinernema carpocapsae]
MTNTDRSSVEGSLPASFVSPSSLHLPRSIRATTHVDSWRRHADEGRRRVEDRRIRHVSEMSFSWANNFAKNALKSAQKRIDSVLDIQEEEAEGEDEDQEQDTSDNGEREASVLGDSKGTESEQTVTEEPYYTSSVPFHDAVNLDTTEKEESAGFPLNDLTFPNETKTEWSSGWETREDDEIVDSEPNPIRDGHSQSNLLHHSPTSNSPDEEEAERSRGSPVLDLSLVNIAHLDEEREASPIMLPLSAKNHDDATTIVSSDIEVLRHHDEWSMASSCHVKQKQNMDASMDNALENALVAHSDRNLVDQLAVLKARFDHRGRRLEELTKQNEALRSQSSSLGSRNKHLTSSLKTSEAKLQKQLAEKEKALNELMEEGQRLAEHSGKQSKEIRRLKQQANQLELVTSARDSAMEELQAAHAQVSELTAKNEELREKLKRAEMEQQKTLQESNLTQASSVLVQQHVRDREAKVEQLLEEAGNLESQLREQTVLNQNLSRSVDMLNAKLMSRKARDCIDSEKLRCVQDELDEQKIKNIVLQRTIQELEKRLEQLLISKSELATQIQQANAPLLENISHLEKEMWELKRAHAAEVESYGLLLKEQQAGGDSLKRKYESTLAKLSELSAEKITVEKDYERARNELRQKEKSCESLMTEVHNTRMELEAKRRDFDSREDLEGQYRYLMNDYASQTQTLSALRAENETLNSKIGELELKFATQEASRTPTPNPLERGRIVRESDKSDTSMLLSDINLPAPCSSSAALDELRHLTVLHEQTLIHVGQLEAELETTHHFQEALKESEQRYEKLNVNYENLLEAHGERLEKTEELELDLCDMKQLLKEQMEEFLRQSSQSS